MAAKRKPAPKVKPEAKPDNRISIKIPLCLQ
jgi:hypothetical protein